MSLESAKKYGYIASVLNVTVPIIAIIAVLGALYMMFYQIIANPTNASPAFWQGTIIGVGIALFAAGIIALILFFLSMHKLSNYYQEPAIFKKVLYGFVLTVLGSIITSVIIIIGFATTLSTDALNIITNGNFMDIITRFMIIYAATFIISMIFAIINGVLYWQAFNKLGEKSGVETFKTVGLLYLIGSIIPGIGSIILWIAWIFAAQSYKRLQPQPINPPSDATTPTPTNTPSFDKIYCSYCGIENDTNSIYCKQCGKNIQPTETNT
jgi:uncharacterized membrane protein